MATICAAAILEAEAMGRDGRTPHDAYDAADGLYGRESHPRGAIRRSAFIAVYEAAFEAFGWRWQITDWNARRNASGRVVRAKAA
jgi:hypothetical protein